MTRKLGRRLGGALLVLILAGAGVVGLVEVFSSRDSSSVAAPSGPGGQSGDAGDRHLPAGATDPLYRTNPPTSGAHVVVAVTRDDTPLSDDQLLTALEEGDVVLVYGDPRQSASLRALAASVAGPFDPSIAAAGQAVILDPQTSVSAGPVLALAWRRELRAPSTHDPALATFASYWLGRGARGS